MKMQEIRARAKAVGVPANGSKAAVIHRIQKAEGNQSCFGTKKSCNQYDCCWRDDCLPATRS